MGSVGRENESSKWWRFGCVLGMAFGCWKQCVVPGCVVGNEEHLQCGFVTNVCGAIMDD